MYVLLGCLLSHGRYINVVQYNNLKSIIQDTVEFHQNPLHMCVKNKALLHFSNTHFNLNIPDWTSTRFHLKGWGGAFPWWRGHQLSTRQLRWGSAWQGHQCHPRGWWDLPGEGGSVCVSVSVCASEWVWVCEETYLVKVSVSMCLIWLTWWRWVWAWCDVPGTGECECGETCEGTSVCGPDMTYPLKMWYGLNVKR